MSTDLVRVVGVLPVEEGAALAGCLRKGVCQGESFCVVAGRVVELNDTFL